MGPAVNCTVNFCVRLSVLRKTAQERLTARDDATHDNMHMWSPRRILASELITASVFISETRRTTHNESTLSKNSCLCTTAGQSSSDVCYTSNREPDADRTRERETFDVTYGGRDSARLLVAVGCRSSTSVSSPTRQSLDTVLTSLSKLARLFPRRKSSASRPRTARAPGRPGAPVGNVDILMLSDRNGFAFPRQWRRLGILASRWTTLQTAE